MKFTLLMEMYPGYFSPNGTFEAKDIQEATEIASRWGSYQRMKADVRESTPLEQNEQEASFIDSFRR